MIDNFNQMLYTNTRNTQERRDLNEEHPNNPQDSGNHGKPASQTWIFLIPGIQDSPEAGKEIYDLQSIWCDL